jgi:hypothetical protein
LKPCTDRGTQRDQVGQSQRQTTSSTQHNRMALLQQVTVMVAGCSWRRSTQVPHSCSGDGFPGPSGLVQPMPPSGRCTTTLCAAGSAAELQPHVSAHRGNKEEAASSASGRSNRPGPREESGSAGTTVVWALVQVLGRECVPHLAEQWKVQGRQYLEALRAGIMASDSYPHYPAYLK